MFHELILVCTSISGVVTTLPELVLADGSDSCVTDNSCEHQYSDGYTYKVAGSTQDVPVTNCEALNVHYNRWAAERITIRVILRWLSKIEAVQNTTSEILVKLDILKGRQAASAALQVTQFFLFVGYLLTLAILYAVKKCRQHRARQVEEEVELMEQKLMDRKARRRAAADKKAAQEIQ